jgi:hypothetical protein
MRRSFRALIQATALTLLGAGVIVAAASRPYIIITHDGHRVLAESKPRIEGLAAYVRLLPNRQLAVIKEELIDWKRTEAANAGLAPIALPAGSTFVEKEDKKPITHTIVGTPTPVNRDAPLTFEDGLRVRYRSAHDARQQHLTRRLQLQEELKTLEAGGTAAAGGDDQRAARANEIRKSIEDIDGAIAKLDAELETMEKDAAVQGWTLN